MRAYWPGLVLFLDHPWLDLDNNAAERALRPAVVGRKNFYGSGSQWSGQLAATMMSLLNTVKLWGLNPRLWLASYLQACAQAGGRAPDDWNWRRPDGRLSEMSCRVAMLRMQADGLITLPASQIPLVGAVAQKLLDT